MSKYRITKAFKMPERPPVDDSRWVPVVQNEMRFTREVVSLASDALVGWWERDKFVTGIAVNYEYVAKDRMIVLIEADDGRARDVRMSARFLIWWMT